MSVALTLTQNDFSNLGILNAVDQKRLLNSVQSLQIFRKFYRSHGGAGLPSVSVSYPNGSSYTGTATDTSSDALRNLLNAMFNESVHNLQAGRPMASDTYPHDTNAAIHAMQTVEPAVSSGFNSRMLYNDEGQAPTSSLHVNSHSPLAYAYDNNRNRGTPNSEALHGSDCVV